MDRRFAAITIVFTALVWAGYLTLDALHLELHFLLGRLNHGVSSGKILFLLGFVTAVMLRLLLCRTPKPNPRWAYGVLIASLTLGLGGAMAGHLAYVNTYDLPLDTPTFHGQDGHLSINSTTHIHVSKASIAHSIDALNLPGMHERFDTGRVYTAAVPAWIALLIGLSFLTATAMLIWLAPGVVQHMSNGQRQAGALLWAFAGCAVCKCILDGGPLAYDAVIGMACLSFIAFGVTRVKVALVSTSIIAWWVVVYLIDPSVLLTQITRAVERGAIYGLIAVVGLWIGQPTKPTWSIRIGTGLLTACAVGLSSIAWHRHVTPLRQPREASAWQVYDWRKTMDENWNNTNSTLINGVINAAILYQTAGEDALRPRYTTLAPRNRFIDHELIGEVALLKTNSKSLKLPENPTAVFIQTQADTGYQGPGERMRFIWRVDGEYGPVISGLPNQLTQNERFVGYYLLDQMLRDAGVEQYILTPYLVRRVQQDQQQTARR